MASTVSRKKGIKTLHVSNVLRDGAHASTSLTGKPRVSKGAIKLAQELGNRFLFSVGQKLSTYLEIGKVITVTHDMIVTCLTEMCVKKYILKAVASSYVKKKGGKSDTKIGTASATRAVMAGVGSGKRKSGNAKVTMAKLAEAVIFLVGKRAAAIAGANKRKTIMESDIELGFDCIL